MNTTTQVRNSLHANVQALYNSGLSLDDASAILRSELSASLTDLGLLKKDLPDLASDKVYGETAKQMYKEMVEHWIAEGNLYTIIETIKACRFETMTTAIQMWVRLSEFALAMDTHCQPIDWKAKLKRSFGTQPTYWTKRVEGMHPAKLEEFRLRNGSINDQAAAKLLQPAS